MSRSGRGVALPTRRQARAWSLLSPPERHELHQHYFHHRGRQCPLEAAYSAHVDDRAMVALIILWFVLFGGAVALYVLLPHTRVDVPIDQRNETLRSQVVLFASLVLTVPWLMTVPRLIRERSENHRLAARGPDCSPWAELDNSDLANFSAAWHKRILPGLGEIGLAVLDAFGLHPRSRPDEYEVARRT